MNLLNSRLFYLSVILLELSSCSKILSRRTDTQAWLEFDQEIQKNRQPASLGEKATETLGEKTKKTQGALALQNTLMNTSVRSILLKCGENINVSSCFETTLTLHFDETFRAIQNRFPDLKTDEYKIQRKKFFEARSFEKVSDAVARFHRSILSGLDLKAREHASDLFKSCERFTETNSGIESFKILKNLQTEIPKGTYACLSDHWTADQLQLLDETSERLGIIIESESAKHWILSHEISPIYEGEILNFVEQKSRSELAQFNQKKSEIFAEYDLKAPLEKQLKPWSIKLREQFPYSPVEQWVIAYAKGSAP